MKIKKLDLVSFARFQSVLGALLGLLAGVIYSFGGLVLDILVSAELVVSAETSGLGHGTLLAFGALIGMSLNGALAGLITGLIAGTLYNLAAKLFGGVNLDFE